MTNTINPHAHYRPSDNVTHDERQDAKSALQFAKTIELELNMLVGCSFPSIDCPVKRLEHSRGLSHKLRVFARTNHFECAFISVRWADPNQLNHEGIAYLIHVPEPLQELFKGTLSGWLDKPKAEQAVNDQTIHSDGKIHSSFNYLMRFIHPDTARCEPTALSATSGRTWGPRVFVTRNLWLAARIKHRKLMGQLKAKAMEAGSRDQIDEFISKINGDHDRE